MKRGWYVRGQPRSLPQPLSAHWEERSLLQQNSAPMAQVYLGHECTKASRTSSTITTEESSLYLLDNEERNQF
ncbi:hypothetical protein Pmani_001321 [Petrolisthes manimaculis]|uniref:Uncharacterized protein n=1 Tax=Petrolisthes manimaculis TaxID=1843537 RepID=A0AAE1QKX4_9EUCA|nr:hypothetical protein Pmani_001321 [Petrolisthes manimaculis]